MIVAAALAGALDTGAFVARRPRLIVDHPGRWAGSLTGLGLWLALAASSSRDRDTAGPRTVGLAAAVAAGNAGLLATHLRHGVASPRVFMGAGLATLALGVAAASLASG